jgi:outer membrane lipoprotein SlyB
MKTTLLISTLFASVLALSACSSYSPNVYKGGQTQNEQTVRMGTVESVRQVKIEGSQSGVGSVAGGVVGGVAGSSVGGGKGSTIGSVLGAVVGGVAGNAIEKSGTTKEALEITVKLDNGDLKAIVQEADETFQKGDRVRLLSGSGVTRVVKP